MSNYIAFNSTKTIPSESVERQFEGADRWFFSKGGPESQIEFFGGDGTGANCTGGGDSVTITFPGNEYSAGTYYGALWDDFDGTTRRQTNFDFIVVCMTARINVTETYRDADVYRLSCTATPQGGTAPYTYSWIVLGGLTISGQGTETITAEFSVGAAGSINVGVSDSSTPQCNASDAFSVCGMTCDFTTSLVPFPPATSPFVYECQASVAGGTGPYSYEWSPSGSGQTAQISMPDNKRRAIRLTVTDSSDPACKAFKTHYVGVVQFEVSTDPGSSSPGTPQGSRDAMLFYVTVKATADGEMDNPPSTLVFELHRRKDGATSTLTGNLVAGSNPVKYEAQWNVTQQKGRWEIKTQGYISNTLQFKIDKREQIVEVAQSWVGAAQGDLGANANCNNLSARVYNHVGLPLSGFTDPQFAQASLPCSGDGCLLFFNIMEGVPPGPYTARSPWNPSHVAIEAGGQRININSTTGGSTTVTQEAVDKGVHTVPPWYDPNIQSRSTVDLDED